jgi:aminoglycoside/choline kinase family phosphotransferase
MPRMWAHLNRNLTRPGLAGVARWIDRHVPAEVRQ